MACEPARLPAPSDCERLVQLLREHLTKPHWWCELRVEVREMIALNSEIGEFLKARTIASFNRDRTGVDLADGNLYSAKLSAIHTQRRAEVFLPILREARSLVEQALPKMLPELPLLTIGELAQIDPTETAKRCVKMLAELLTTDAKSGTGVPLAEAEIRVREWLAANAKDNPVGITRDAVSAGAGVSAGQVSKTTAWKAFRERRDAEKTAGERSIPLTGTMQAVMPGNCERPDKIAALMEEQAAEEAEQNRRYARRHGPS